MHIIPLYNSQPTILHVHLVDERLVVDETVKVGEGVRYTAVMSKQGLQIARRCEIESDASGRVRVVLRKANEPNGRGGCIRGRRGLNEVIRQDD
jgi:hypothetical protein